MNSAPDVGTLATRMRLVWTLLLAGYWAVSGWAVGSTNLPQTLQIAGQRYLPLQEWADAKQLHLERKDEEVRLTNRLATLTLKANSHRAEMNGISLFLAFPLCLRQGTLWVSQADLSLCLEPLLSPPKHKPTVKVVAISAGHGGKDSGYQVNGQQEKKYTLLLAEELQRRCARAGFKTVLVRDEDKFIERVERTRLAKQRKADVFLELHYNCAGPGNTESKGVEVYCLTPDGANSTNGGSDEFQDPLAGNRQDERNMLLAFHIHTALVQKAALADRGVRRARFEVLREAEMPAVLIEAAFMSQPEEMKRIQDAGHRRRTAQAILEGLLAYKRLLDR